jgi:SNF2 family DNA or RNA helicase
MPKKFWPHQEKAWQYAENRDRIALFMEMRCGKTLVAIRWAQHKVKNGTILVIGPVEVLDDWIEELRDAGETRIIHATSLSAQDREDVVTTVRNWNSPRRLWVLFNYEAIRASRSLFLERIPTWDAVIADESTRLRNPKAKTTKIVTRLGASVRYRAILSGLPNPEGPEDFFSQFVFLNGSFNGHDNFWVWRSRMFYQPVGQQSWQWVQKAGSILSIKSEVGRESFRMTRKRANIGGTKLYNRWVVEPTSEQVRATKQVMRQFELDGHKTQWATVRDVWLARIAGGYLPEAGPVDPDTGEPTTVYRRVSTRKTDILVDRLQTDLRAEAVVVWFRFNAELHDAHRALQAAKIPCAVITGVTPRPERVRLRRAFQAGEYRVLLIQLRTGLYGLNLSRASTAVYFSNMFDLEVRAQSEDRIIHGMKTESSHCIDIVTKGSIDVVASQALRQKWRDVKMFDTAMASAWTDYFRDTYGKQSGK